MQRYTIYLYLEVALHVSGGTSTHHQERIQLYLQQLIFVTPFLLSAAISWNRFECAVGSVRNPQHTQTGSNSSTILRYVRTCVGARGVERGCLGNNELKLSHVNKVQPIRVKMIPIATAFCRCRGRVGTGLSVLWVAYAIHSTLKPVLTDSGR
jgi:hypothetical protein